MLKKAVCTTTNCCRKLLRRNYRSVQNNLTSGMQIDRPENAKRIALVGTDEGSITYGQMLKRTAGLVAVLRSKYCIERGDRVLCRVEKNLNGLALYLATLRLGAIYVPLNPAYTIEETRHFVEDSDPRMFVTCTWDKDCAHKERVEHVVASSDLYNAPRSSSDLEFGIEHMDPDEVACICYTSGTTGLPKGAMLTHGGLRWNAETLVESWQFSKKDILLHMLPFYHVHGMFISLNCTFYSQSVAIYRPKFDPVDAFHWLPQTTVMMGVPTYYSRLIGHPELDAVAKNIRLFISGSAPLSPSLSQKFRAETGHRLLERFGMTEAAVITSNTNEMCKDGSVGRVLPGGQIRTGPEKVVEVKVPSLFAGYWRNESKTREEFTEDGFFITGDIGEIDDDGFLWLHGRAKDLIITGGLNVYPREVENAVDSLPFVQESAVIGVPDDDLGEAVIAVCVRNPSITDQKFSRDLLQHKLSNYKIPKTLVFVDELPRNSMGKIEKTLLRKRYANLFRSKTISLPDNE